jgi:hypothetical protein
MLRSIFAAIATGIKNAFGYAFFIFAWPFRLFTTPARTPMPSPPLEAIKRAAVGAASPGLKPSDVVQSTVRDSVIAWSWANGSISDRDTRPLPSALSRKMKGWLVGLNYTQLLKLKSAGPNGVLEHSAGRMLIVGVPPIGPLPAVEVRYPPPPVDPKAPRQVKKIA